MRRCTALSAVLHEDQRSADTFFELSKLFSITSKMNHHVFFSNFRVTKGLQHRARRGEKRMCMSQKHSGDTEVPSCYFERLSGNFQISNYGGI